MDTTGLTTERIEWVLRDGYRSVKRRASGWVGIVPEAAAARRLEELPEVDEAVTTG